MELNIYSETPLKNRKTCLKKAFCNLLLYQFKCFGTLVRQTSILKPRRGSGIDFTVLETYKNDSSQILVNQFLCLCRLHLKHCHYFKEAYFENRKKYCYIKK